MGGPGVPVCAVYLGAVAGWEMEGQGGETVSELTICPNCGAKIRVVETNPLETSIERVRLCPKCGHQVVTGETILRVRYQGDQPQAS